jgi:hypothetical protein
MEVTENSQVAGSQIAGETSPGEESATTLQQSSILHALLTKRTQLIDALQQIDKETREIQQKLGRRLEELRNRRRPLEEAMAHLEALLKIEGWVGIGDEGNSLAPQDPGQNSKLPLEAAHDLLSKSGKPIHYRELATKLLAYGVPISGQDPAATLLSKMNRDSRFKRYGRGVYGLASWKIRRNKKQKRSRSRKSRRSHN